MLTGDKVMDTTIKKLNLIHWIAELDDEVTLNVLDIIKEQSTQTDWWDTVSDAEKNSIEEGLSDLRKGKTVAHSEVKKRYEKWL
jgi:predicted transcriptional regulator